MKWNTRVRYQKDLTKKAGSNKKVMIIDESDERMFSNLNEFYDKTK